MDTRAAGGGDGGTRVADAGARCAGDLSTQCGWCGGPMRPEHAHYRCTVCGQRDTCCEVP